MPIPKNGKHKEYARYAVHCSDMVTVAKESGRPRYSSRDGGQMAEACRRYFEPPVPTNNPR